MRSNKTHYIFAGIAFFAAFFTYLLTMQPSVSFWDCGEFAAAAAGLQVGHPPGSPLWTIIGRFAIMLPTFADHVARYNLFSVLSSALCILLIYLTTARLIKMWRGEVKSLADELTTYGGALIAALCYTFTDSFWFNAVESEVYAFGSLFIALIPWLMLVWYDHADEEHSEKYLLLVAYIIGLSLGVHQLALLAIFPCFMLVYYRRRVETTPASWIVMVLSSCVAFVIAYKLVLSELVELLGGEAIVTAYGIIGAAITVWIYNVSTKSTASKEKGIFGISKRTFTQIAIAFIARYAIGFIASKINPSPNAMISQITGYALILGTIIGIVYSQREKKALLNFSLWAAFLLFMGYSTYYMIIVRAGQEPPMNQHHASDFKTITEFINREQYGYRPPFPRRVLDETGQKAGPTWDNYTSDMDFFWSYQTNQMYNRYFLWNFVGRYSQEEGTGVDWSKTWGIPFLLGLFGLYWHFKRDPKRALTILAAFILFGWATAWYQNQQDPQPRERDYFYVGAFYFYAMWVGIGTTGVMELLRARKRRESEEENADIPISTGEGNVGLLGGALLAAVILVPLNQCIGLAGMVTGKTFDQSSKWREYSRAHNTIPLEYAYNVLQSCEKDAILFTAGDNDTFPLWCAQDVYGVRRDVRIVNLSLGNMSWYIKQLKKDVWGVGKKIELQDFPDKKLAAPDNSPEGVRDSPEASKIVNVPVTADAMRQFSGNPAAEASMMTWRFTGEIPLEKGNYYFRISDQLVYDIVKTNISSRPIYFAPFVQDNYTIGLRQYMVSEGMAQRITPVKQSGGGPLGPINEDVSAQSAFNLVSTPSLTPKRGYLINTFRDPAARWSNADRTNFAPFFSFQRAYYALAERFASEGKIEEAKKTLDILDTVIPPERVRYDDQIMPLVGQLYARLGNAAKAKKYSTYAIGDMEKAYNETANAAQLGSREAQGAVQYAEALIAAGEIEKAQTVLQHLAKAVTNPRDQGRFQFRILEVEAMMAEKRGDKPRAVALYDQFFDQYGKDLASTSLAFEFDLLHDHVDSLKRSMGIASASKDSGNFKKDSLKK